jgi:hypothetical protein
VRQSGTLILKGSNKEVDAENITVTVNTKSRIDQDSESITLIPTSQIREITITDHRRGFQYGSIGTGLSIL